eukprot:3772849-Amphidinium_carterae.2
MNSTTTHKDQPPIRDGNEPELYWRAKKREIRLWQSDTDVARERQGIRPFRALQGKAKLMADVFPDAGNAWHWHYMHHGVRIPPSTAERARVQRRTRRLQRTYFDGMQRSEDTKHTHMGVCRPAADAHQTSITISQTLADADGKSVDLDDELEFTQFALRIAQYHHCQYDAGSAACGGEATDEWYGESWFESDDQELQILYGETNHVRYAFDCEGEVWIHPWDLQSELEGEALLQQNLASFAAVEFKGQRWKRKGKEAFRLGTVRSPKV